MPFLVLMGIIVCEFIYFTKTVDHLPRSRRLKLATFVKVEETKTEFLKGEAKLSCEKM